MHHADPALRAIAHRWVSAAVDRAFDGPSDIGNAPPQVIRPAAITAGGLGASSAWELWESHVAPANLALDSARFMAFLPIAPTPIATAFDMVVSSAALGAEAWLEAAGAVDAENEVIAWLASEFGLPPSAVGCFVSGGSAGNLSALAVARDRFRRRTGQRDCRAVMSSGTHSSVANALRLLDIEPIIIPADRLDAAALSGVDLSSVCAIVATAGTTNAGIVDDLDGLADVAQRHQLWLHVDGAYGAAAALVPSRGELFAGLGRADSVIIDPHKWLFAPLDSCALIYRDAMDAHLTHRQHAPYLDPLRADDVSNPTDLAFHLTRRARGLPLWMSLAVHGTDAYREAIETTLRVARQAAERVRTSLHLELVMEPQLSVLLVRRVGWTEADYYAWSKELLSGHIAFVVPTLWHGEVVARFAVLHPGVTITLFDELFSTMQ